MNVEVSSASSSLLGLAKILSRKVPLRWLFHALGEVLGTILMKNLSKSVVTTSSSECVTYCSGNKDCHCFQSESSIFFVSGISILDGTYHRKTNILAFFCFAYFYYKTCGDIFTFLHPSSKWHNFLTIESPLVFQASLHTEREKRHFFSQQNGCSEPKMRVQVLVLHVRLCGPPSPGFSDIKILETGVKKSNLLT